VQKSFDSPLNIGIADGDNARGKDASFICGAFVAFSIAIDADTKSVVGARFRTNGCGYMIAAADCLTEMVKGKHLSDLHGLNENDLRDLIFEMLGELGASRQQCADCSIRALRSAFADYRSRQVEEFRGEKALICTCFSVTVETLELNINEKLIKTVDEVTQRCRAGGGCGSCRMLIQEMLDHNL
jgi:NifU-like protein